eukprot:scaffold559313_cov63-Attheya_sp.AAC.2
MDTSMLGTLVVTLSFVEIELRQATATNSNRAGWETVRSMVSCDFIKRIVAQLRSHQGNPHRCKTRYSGQSRGVMDVVPLQQTCHTENQG